MDFHMKPQRRTSTPSSVTFVIISPISTCQSIFFPFHSPILVRYQDSGRSRGYAHILLDDPKYVEQALAKNGQYIGDRYVRVQQANGQKSSIFFEIKLIVVDVPTTNKNVTLPANCNSVFLKNLPYECTEEEIQEVFKYFPVFLRFILF